MRGQPAGGTALCQGDKQRAAPLYLEESVLTAKNEVAKVGRAWLSALAILEDFFRRRLIRRRRRPQISQINADGSLATRERKEPKGNVFVFCHPSSDLCFLYRGHPACSSNLWKTNFISSTLS